MNGSEIKLQCVLDRTKLFYTYNFGELKADVYNGKIEFVNNDCITKLVCKPNDYLPYHKDEEGREYLYFVTGYGAYKVYPIEHHYISISSL